MVFEAASEIPAFERGRKTLKLLRGGGSTVRSLYYDLMYLALFSQAYLCVLLLCEFIYGRHQVYIN